MPSTGRTPGRFGLGGSKGQMSPLREVAGGPERGNGLVEGSSASCFFSVGKKGGARQAGRVEVNGRTLQPTIWG